MLPDSAITIAVAPLVIVFVAMLRYVFNIQKHLIPLVSIGVSVLAVVIYIASNGGFVLSNLFSYVEAIVGIAAVASGAYSWIKTVSNQPDNSKPVVSRITGV